MIQKINYIIPPSKSIWQIDTRQYVQYVDVQTELFSPTFRSTITIKAVLSECTMEMIKAPFLVCECQLI